ncbi:MAG: hypothetical protein ACXAB4_02560 [Candidatus Hodarchaeales archaeon]|jgi:DNA modification methylase
MKSSDWDWADAKTRYLTFGLHDYPARMIPQIPERLIRRYLLKNDFKRNNSLVVDPFCGSGAVLAQARLFHLNAAGYDVNPLAKLISEVHASRVGNKFAEEAKRIRLRIYDASLEKKGDFSQVSIHEFPNFDHWFKLPVLRELSWLRNQIMSVKHSVVQRFLWFCFSITQFKVSNIDRSSSRFIRVMKASQLNNHAPNPLNIFFSTFDNALTRVEAFSKRCSEKNSTEVFLGDAQKIALPDQSASIVITSPPYGEERNTLDYLRWSKLSLYWMGMTQKRLLSYKKQGLGNQRSDDLQTPSKTATAILFQVARQKPKRALESAAFFRNYLSALKEIERILIPGAYACIVIGDRSISRRTVDMNTITIELAPLANLAYITSFYRQIPRKLIPSRTPTGATISKENIVILQKKN